MATALGGSRLDGLGPRLARWWGDPDVRFGAGVAGGVLGFLVFVGILYPAAIAILFLGAVLGSLSALIALGLVLVHRANRIINFAQGDLGAVAAILAASLMVGPDWGFFPAVAVGFVFALVLGAVVEVGIIRRFSRAPRLQLTVATLGVLQLCQGIQLGLPRLFDYDVAPQPPLPFDFSWEWDPVVFNAGHLMIMIVVPVVAAGLWAFFRFTRVGIAIRASAESSDRAALLGIPVRRIGTLVWVLAAGLSGLAVLLRMPIQGVNIGGVFGLSLLLRALAAAVIGRMENMSVTFAAALVIGMVEQAIFFHTGRTVIVDGVLFFLLIGVLLLQRRGKTTRADDIGLSSWSATREVRPIPRELRLLPEVRWGIGAVTGIVGAFLLIAPLSMEVDQVNKLGIGLVIAMVCISLVLLTGWSGQLNLAPLAFAGFGAAVAGALDSRGWDFFLCLLAAGLTGAFVSVVIGIPALRIRGPLLAVTTLAFALACGTYLLNSDIFGWVPSSGQRFQRPELFNKFDLESEYAMYYFLLLLFGAMAASAVSIRRSRTGRLLIATRDNARAAQSYGVNPLRARISAFALAGFMAALAGGAYLFHQRGLSDTLLRPDSGIRVFAAAVIGGLGTVTGAAIAAAWVTFLDYSPFTRQPLSRLLASGIGMLVVLMIIPNGIGGLIYDLRDGALRRIARLKGIVVPSLLADVRVDEDDGMSAPIAEIAAEERAGGRLRALSRARKRSRDRAPADGGVPDDAVLVVRHVDVSYGKTQVLFGVDFHVRDGEIVALLGTNGAGKSTLLNAISGLVTPSRGTISFGDADITRLDPVATLAAGVVFMPGGKGVFPTLTVAENLRLAAWPYEKDQEYVRAATEQVLTYFPILRERWDQKAGNLSGGEQQMLTLSQAFISRPKLLMIDELSLGLAPVIVQQLLEIVRAIHANGTTVVLVEQSVNVAITLAERAVFMEKGEVRFDGPTRELLDRPDILRAVFLGSGSASGGNGAVPAGARAPAFEARCEHCGHEHPVMLETRAVSATFGGVRAVDSVDLSIREGEIIGIIGPNGSGKTTFFDLVSGFVVPAGGRILINGEDVTDLSPSARAEIGLGRSFQDARLFPALTVREAIAVAFERHHPARDPIAAALVSGAVRVAERQVATKVDELIELMHLEAFADKFVGELSTGSRRIVDIACSLAHQPTVLLLDEPSSGIAQRETEALGPVLLDIRQKTGAALLVVEHDMPLISSISDRLVALELGRVVAEGEPQAVLEDPAVIEGYLGSSVEVIQRSGTSRARAGARAGRTPLRGRR